MKKILIPFLLLAALLTFVKIGFALSGSIYRPSLQQMLVDGDMEKSGTTSWSVIAATVSKQTTNPHGGKQVLRVTADGSQIYGDSYQSILTEGKRYRITGWARAGGSAAYPSVFFGGNSQVWAGTVSTAWQRFDVIGTTIGGANLFLIAYGVTGAGQYVEFDDVFISEVTGYTQVQDTQSLTDGDMEGTPVALADAAMEVTGTASWTPSQSTLSKQTTDPHSGAQLLRVTATAAAGARNPQAYQIVLTAGKTYRITGYARSDGVQTPKVFVASLVWTGTTATSWQAIDTTFVAAGTAPVFYFSITDPAGTEYVEFDDLSIVDVGTTSWSSYQATLSKQTTSPHGGRQLLRITADGSGPSAYAIQNVLTMGKKYRVTGWAKSDGVQVPEVYMGGGLLAWTGTNSTAWQRIDATAVATGNTYLYLAQDTNNSGYVEFDDVTITEDKGKQQVIEKQVVIDGDMEGLPAALVDGAMEAAAASTTAGGAWTSYQSFISKQPGSPQSGARVLRSVCDGVNANGGPFQQILTAGKTYHVTGWARGDGTTIPYVLVGGGSLSWTGTSANTWQRVDVTIVADGVRLYLWGGLVSAGHYVEFDDFSAVDVGTTAWSPGSSNAVLTKTTTGQHSGNYALRAAWGSGTYAYANNGSIFTPGKPYRMTGWYRGDGVVTPLISMSGGQTVWTGIATTTWQKIDTTFVPLYNSLYLLYYSSSPAWVEWDDLYATLVQ